MTEDTPIQFLKGIGPKRAKLFNRLGINTIEDILYYFPRRYEDRRRFLSISQLKEGDVQSIKAEVLARGVRQSWKRKRFNILEVVVGDDTGKIKCIWFNQPYLKDYFKVGQTLVLYGKIERYLNRLQMNSPEFEIVSGEEDEPCPSLRSDMALKEGRGESLNIGRIVPKYLLPESITQRYLRQLIKYALDEYLPKVNDFLPYDIRLRNNLLNLAKSLMNIHFPDNLDMQKIAYARLSFEEFFLFQIPLALRKLKKKKIVGISHKVEGNLVRDFIDSLPFKLTSAQEKVIAEIKLDMAQPQTMQRLLQGDVGSGKTIVATLATLFAIQGGYQVAFMVPTEILARQHYVNIKNQISTLRLRSGLMVSEVEPSTLRLRSGLMVSEVEPSKIKNKIINIELLIGSLNKKDKESLSEDIREGRIDLLIGTHALLEEEVKFKNLGLVVIDEQHKFGVGQRALLPKKGPHPDVLIMTATPIPRTLAITLYGDLDISVISELPPGRGVIKTVRFNESQKLQAYDIAKEQLRLGRQVYIIYPVIEESYVLDIAGAKKRYAELKTGEFKEFRVGLIHGRLKQKEQDEIMLKFKEKTIDVLVSTTVLEVGIDIPNATCMLIEHAQRFGLSQLHQLRGRIGRSKYQSFCILISDAQTEEAKARLEVMGKFTNGFRIAEEDLRIRGPGEFFGLRQSGLCELKIANPLTQMQLLKSARDEAIRLINLDPHLDLRQNSLLKEKLLQRFPEYEKLMVVG